MTDILSVALPLALLFVISVLVSYQLGAMQVALDLLRALPKKFDHRSWGLRILRCDGLLEFEVGWIGRISRCIRRRW